MTYGVVFKRIEWAGLEDLTIIHMNVQAMDPNTYDAYENDHRNIDDLHVGHVAVVGCKNCWIDGCRLMYAGTNPLQIWNCENVTARNNLVAYSFNKGANLNGYYVILNSDYILCCNDTVIGLRHFSIQEGSRYCVVFNCYFETDVNFHGYDGGHNLVEGCMIYLPKHHLWTPIASRDVPRGQKNMLYRVNAFDKHGGNYYQRYHDTKLNEKVRVACDPEAIFEINPQEYPLLIRIDKSPPKAKTLYPITGTCESAGALRERHGRVRMELKKPN
jgi:hypothetical protein